MTDSTGHTKEKVIEKFSKEMLLECYTTDDVKKDYYKLRERLDDPEISNKDLAALIRLIWDFIVAKPSLGLDVKSSKPLSNITFKFAEDGEDNKDIEKAEASSSDSTR